MEEVFGVPLANGRSSFRPSKQCPEISDLLRQIPTHDDGFVLTARTSRLQSRSSTTDSDKGRSGKHRSQRGAVSISERSSPSSTSPTATESASANFHYPEARSSGRRSRRKLRRSSSWRPDWRTRSRHRQSTRGRRTQLPGVHCAPRPESFPRR